MIAAWDCLYQLDYNIDQRSSINAKSASRFLNQLSSIFNTSAKSSLFFSFFSEIDLLKIDLQQASSDFTRIRIRFFFSHIIWADYVICPVSKFSLATFKFVCRSYSIFIFISHFVIFSVFSFVINCFQVVNSNIVTDYERQLTLLTFSLWLRRLNQKFSTERFESTIFVLSRELFDQLSFSKLNQLFWAWWQTSFDLLVEIISKSILKTHQ